MSAKRLGRQLEAGSAPKHHLGPTIGTQVVGEHLYAICQIIRRLTENEPTIELLMAALDLATPTLEDEEVGLISPESLSEKSRAVLCFADIAATGYFSLRQFNLGNRSAVMVLERILTLTHDLIEKDKSLPEEAVEIYGELSMGMVNALRLSGVPTQEYRMPAPPGAVEEK